LSGQFYAPVALTERKITYKVEGWVVIISGLDGYGEQNITCCCFGIRTQGLADYNLYTD